jgi:DNA polymerase-3 subunit chi
MAEISFYHLINSTLEEVLPVLLKKTLDAGKRAVVMAGTDERLETLSSILWTSEPDSWIPHGSLKDGHPKHQPIWFTISWENPNQATYLFLTDGATAESLEGFDRCFDLFDGNEIASVQAARDRWTKLKNGFHDRNYWQQNSQGKWEKKASAGI